MAGPQDGYRSLEQSDRPSKSAYVANSFRRLIEPKSAFGPDVPEAMRDEEEMASRFVEAEGPFAERLEGILHARKRERFTADAEVYGLYRRIVDERREIIAAYSQAMTALIARILANAKKRGEIRVDDIEAASSVVRDAVTVFVHPAHVAAAVTCNLPSKTMARNVVRTLCAAFKAGVDFASRSSRAVGAAIQIAT